MVKKRIITVIVSLILSVILFTGQIPVSAAEADSGKCGPYLYWSFDDETCVLTVSGEGPMYNYSNFSDASDCAPFSVHRGKIKHIVIEEGCTYIGTYAFSGLLHAVDIKLPESSLKEIGAYAFNYCIDVTRIIIPDSVEIIGEYAFTTCQNLRMIRFGNGIKELPKGVCYRAGELIAVFLPEGCTAIGNAAFYECKKLTDIDLTNIETIGANAFNTCSVLKNVTFGENIKNIGENSFYACSAISDFVFLGTPEFVSSGFAYGTAWYKAKADGLYVICDEILLCKGTYTGSVLTVPEGVKSIGESAFTNNSYITSVVLPEGLERIGNFAFFKLSKITSLKIPASVNYIGDRAVGYKAVGTSQSEIDPNFTMYGKGGAAWEYAARLGLNYICLHEYENVSDLEDCTLGGVSCEECIFCGDRINEKEIPSDYHSFIISETKADCENNGIKSYDCKKCSVSFEQTTEKAKGHSADVWQLIKDASCLENGIIGLPCKSCGVLLEEKLIEKKEHKAASSTRVHTPLTCTSDGIYEEYCEYCDTALSTVTEKAQGHAAQKSFTTVKEAIDGVPGYEVKYCTACGIIVEGRWFTVGEETVSLIESREAVAVCTALIGEVITGNASGLSEAALDFNSDGKLDAKDSVTLKKLSDQFSDRR